jgi:hypothetical protein
VQRRLRIQRAVVRSLKDTTPQYGFKILNPYCGVVRNCNKEQTASCRYFVIPAKGGVDFLRFSKGCWKAKAAYRGSNGLKRLAGLFPET